MLGFGLAKHFNPKGKAHCIPIVNLELIVHWCAPAVIATYAGLLCSQPDDGVKHRRQLMGMACIF